MVKYLIISLIIFGQLLAEASNICPSDMIATKYMNNYVDCRCPNGREMSFNLANKIYITGKCQDTAQISTIPPAIGSLILWLDASDIYGDGYKHSFPDGVTSWIDKSGYGNHLTASANPPSYVEIVNPSLQAIGYPAVEFSNAATLSMGGNLNGGSFTQGLTIFIVMIPYNPPPASDSYIINSNFLSIQYGGTLGNKITITDVDDNIHTVTSNLDYFTAFDVSNLVVGDLKTSAYLGGTYLYMYLNPLFYEETAMVSARYSGVYPRDPGIGAEYAIFNISSGDGLTQSMGIASPISSFQLGGGGFNQAVQEILIYNGHLGYGERNEIIKYLAGKWLPFPNPPGGW